MYKNYASSQFQCCSFCGTLKEVPSQIPKNSWILFQYLKFSVWKVGHHYDDMVLMPDAEFNPHHIVTSPARKTINKYIENDIDRTPFFA